MNENIARIVLHAATQLGAAGKYPAASALLDITNPAESLAKHLLRAKIAAQQQRYDESIAHWRQALALEPGHEAAQQGLARAQELHARRGQRLYLRANLYYALLLLVIAGLGAALVGLWLRGGSGAERSDIAALRAAQEQQLQLIQQLAASLKTSGGNAEAPPAELKIEVPGITVRPEGQDLLLSFAEGLFEPGGNVLRPSAQQTLAALGRQFEAAPRTLIISVLGHTDNVALPVARKKWAYQDNSALALARAVAVVEYLRANTRLPGHSFMAQGLGEDSAPYSNDSPDNRVRNRTVVLRVRASKYTLRELK